MGKVLPALITEDSIHFKTGEILEGYKKLDEGIEVNGHFIKKGTFIMLQEKLEADDMVKIKEMIRKQMRLVFWNLFTKNSIIIGNL